jgi:hypothetical protein
MATATWVVLVAAEMETEMETETGNCDEGLLRPRVFLVALLKRTELMERKQVVIQAGAVTDYIGELTGGLGGGSRYS